MFIQRMKYWVLLGLFVSPIAKAQAQTRVSQPRVTAPGQTQTPLDPSVQINQEQVSTVFKDMVVVQRKAKEKGGKFLFNAFGSFDFSDGPITMYGMNTNVGYAFSDFWELYLNYVPSFISQERPIVGKVAEIQVDAPTYSCPSTPCYAAITYAKPKSQIGLELLWIPAYGKDSWGPYQIIRSDTFFKFGAAQITYSAVNTAGGSDSTETGLRYTLLIGKTYFISNGFNLRVGAGMSYLQTITGSSLTDTLDKKFTTVAILESGLVWYF